MVSLNPVSHVRSISPSTEKPDPHRLTLLFGVIIVSCCVLAIGVYLYQWLKRSFEDLGNQALDRKEFQKAADCFTRWLNAPTAKDLQKNKFERLIQGCEKALLSPNLAVQSRVRFLILKGEANLGLNKPDEAVPNFTAVLELDLVNSDNLSRLIQGCEKALLSPDLAVQSRARFLILKGEANLGLNKPAEAVQNFTAVLELGLVNSDNLSRLIQGCEKALLSPDLAVQSRARFLILKGEANLGLNKLAEALQDFTAALGLESADLKLDELSRLSQGCDIALTSENLEEQLRVRFLILKGEVNLKLNSASIAKPSFTTALALLSGNLQSGEFSKVNDCCDCALKSDKLEDEIHARFHFLKGLACLGLQNPSEAKHCFTEAIKYASEGSQILASAYYFLALATKETGDDFYAGELCEKALDSLSEQDLELKTEILTLKALSLMDSKQFPEAIETADSALQLSTDKTPKETLVALYFCLANSYCALKKYTEGFSYFVQVLANIENDPFLRAYILSCRGYYHRAIAVKSDAQINLLQADKDFREASECKSDDRRNRSELLRCMMWPMFEKLKPGESPVTRLTRKIQEDRKVRSVPEPQE